MPPGRTRAARKIPAATASTRPPQLAGPHAGKNPATRPGHPAGRTDELVTLAHTTVPTRDHSEIGKPAAPARHRSALPQPQAIPGCRPPYRRAELADLGGTTELTEIEISRAYSALYG